MGWCREGRYLISRGRELPHLRLLVLLSAICLTMAMLLLVQTTVELGLWLSWVRHCPVQRTHRCWQWRRAPLALRQLLLRLVLSQFSGTRDLIGNQIRVTALVRLCSDFR